MDAGTLNGHEVEVVKLNSFEDKPVIGSPDKLYVDKSTNLIYHYDEIAGYSQLANLSYNLNTDTALTSKIKSWSAGSATVLALDKNTLFITNGAAPRLEAQDITAVTRVILGQE